MTLMPFLPLPASGVTLVGLRRGTLQTLSVSASGAVSRSSIRIKGWNPGAKPARIRSAGSPGLYVVLSDARGGSEVDLIRVRGRKAGVVHRSRTRTWFAGLEANAGKFYLPQNDKGVGTFHLAGDRIIWDRLPVGTVFSPDCTVVGTTLGEGDRPFWLNVSTMSTSVLFSVAELDRGRAVLLGRTGAPIGSVWAVGAWRRGDQFRAIENGGIVYRLYPRTGRASLLPGSKPIGSIDAFAACRAAPLAVTAGSDQIFLLGATRDGGWSKLASLPNTRGKSFLSGVAVEDGGRWAATVGTDGTASLYQIVNRRSIRLVRRAPKFLDPIGVYTVPFTLVTTR